MSTITISGKEFQVQRLTRVQMRDLRKRGFDLVVAGLRMKENDMRITGDDLDAILDVAFPGREADLDAIGLVGQIQLGAAVMSEVFSLGAEIKN